MCRLGQSLLHLKQKSGIFYFLHVSIVPAWLNVSSHIYNTNYCDFSIPSSPLDVRQWELWICRFCSSSLPLHIEHRGLLALHCHHSESDLNFIKLNSMHSLIDTLELILMHTRHSLNKALYLFQWIQGFSNWMQWSCHPLHLIQSGNTLYSLGKMCSLNSGSAEWVTPCVQDA